MKKNLLLLLMTFLISSSIFSQNNDATVIKDAPNVYFKCWQCNMTRMKREIDYVNYVNQRQDAEIVVIVTSRSTGTGRKISVYFEGQDKFEGMNDTLGIAISDIETESVIDDKLIANIKKGLLQYIVKTPILDKLSYQIVQTKEKKVEKIVDPWNSWVFSAGLRGSFNGESRFNRKSFNANFSGGRVTKEDKWNFYASTNLSERNYYFFDSNDVRLDSLTITSERESSYASGSYIKSINDHWSLGVFSNAFSNTYSNYDLNLSAKLGVEYNLFNYEESDRKSLVLTYKLGTSYNDYVDTTIYDKLKETLYSQDISMNIFMKQKWGNIDFGANFFNYLHDIRINSLSFNTNVSWNVFKGFTLSIGGHLSFINNQVNLLKQDADIIGTVLGDRLLATNYNAYTYMGIRYTFGSKYANEVNPRFNSGGSVTYYFF